MNQQKLFLGSLTASDVCGDAYLVAEPVVLVRVGSIEHLLDLCVRHRHRQVPHHEPELLPAEELQPTLQPADKLLTPPRH